MRIVHTCLRYPPATGGVETYVHEIVERTRDIAAERDVRVLTSKMKTHWPVKELLPKSLVNDPPYVQRLEYGRTPFIAYPRLQALEYYLGHHEPNVLHGYSFWYQPADLAARYAKKHNIPFIFHPIYYENAIRRKIRWQVYKKIIGYRTFAAADVVAVISPYEQSLIEKAGFPVKRFELLPPGINTQHYAKVYENPFRKRGISGRILLSVGRVAHGKGLQDVVSCLPDILKNIPDTQFVVVGENFGAKHDLCAQAKALGVESNVHFLGKLTAEELAAAYKHADVFVHPSFYEAFGIVIGEALAAKLPVVARNTSAIPYVAPHEEAGLLFNNNEELSSSLLTLLNNADLREKFGHQGYERVKTEFSWDRVIKKLTALYQELV